MKKIVLVGLILMILFSFGCFTPIEPKPLEPTNRDSKGNRDIKSTQEGLSFETAIVIQADNEENGIQMEYDWLTENACPEQGGPKERTTQQLEQKNGKWYDVLYVECHNGEEIIYYFNIDSFFGKWD